MTRSQNPTELPSQQNAAKQSAQVTRLTAGATLEAPAREWTNDYGYSGYGGPCPPPGPAHRYVFTVYALDVAELGVPAGVTSAACRFNLLAHAIDSASFTATFAQAG